MTQKIIKDYGKLLVLTFVKIFLCANFLVHFGTQFGESCNAWMQLQTTFLLFHFQKPISYFLATFVIRKVIHTITIFSFVHTFFFVGKRKHSQDKREATKSDPEQCSFSVQKVEKLLFFLFFLEWFFLT